MICECGAYYGAEAYFCEMCGKKLKPKFNWLANIFGALFVIAAGFAIVYYNKSESQSSRNNQLYLETKQLENDIQTLKEDVKRYMDENLKHMQEIENINNKINNLKMQRTQSYYETQPPKQEPQIKPLKQAPTAVTKTRTTDKTVKPVIPDPQPIITVPAKEILAKQALEKANAAFQKGIKTGDFEEACQLYLESNKKEGYRKFNERAKLCLRYGNNTEYQCLMDYANRLK